MVGPKVEIGEIKMLAFMVKPTSHGLEKIERTTYENVAIDLRKYPKVKKESDYPIP